MSTIPAFAITENGRLIVDTVRESEAGARDAVLRLLKQPGVRWSDLKAAGYDVVRVSVGAERPRKVATQNGYPIKPFSPPPASPETALTIKGVSTPHPRPARADEQPIRRARP